MSPRLPFGDKGGWMEAARPFDGPIRHYQVLGERSSGTNYLDALLASNLRLPPLTHFQWKHGFPQSHFIPRTLLTLVTFRAPEDWVRSMHRKPWHAPPAFWDMPFSRFLRHEWQSEVDDWIVRDDLRELRRLEHPWRFLRAAAWNHGVRARFPVHRGWVGVSDAVRDAAFGLPVQQDLDPVDAMPFPNLPALRRAKMRGFLSLRRRGCAHVFVRFEDLRADPEAFLDVLCARFGLARRRRFRPVEKWLGTLPEAQEAQAQPTPDRLSADDLHFLWSGLDAGHEAEMGYHRADGDGAR